MYNVLYPILHRSWTKIVCRGSFVWCFKSREHYVFKMQFEVREMHFYPILCFKDFEISCRVQLVLTQKKFFRRLNWSICCFDPRLADIYLVRPTFGFLIKWYGMLYNNTIFQYFQFWGHRNTGAGTNTKNREGISLQNISDPSLIATQLFVFFSQKFDQFGFCPVYFIATNEI